MTELGAHPYTQKGKVVRRDLLAKAKGRSGNWLVRAWPQIFGRLKEESESVREGDMESFCVYAHIVGTAVDYLLLRGDPQKCREFETQVIRDMQAFHDHVERYGTPARTKIEGELYIAYIESIKARLQQFYEFDRKFKPTF